MTNSVTDLITYAAQQIGKPYLWGGESETNGFDCSGLVQAAAGTAGLQLPHHAADQFALTSDKVVPAGVPLQVGDLVFFGSSAATIHHVGIYVGAGKLLNAPHTGAKVRVESLSDFPDLFAATRPLPDGTSTQSLDLAASVRSSGSSGGLLGTIKSVVGAVTSVPGTVLGVGQTAVTLAEHPGAVASGVASGVASQVASAALSGVQRYVVEAVLLAGGVGLVGLGIYRGVKTS